MKTTHMPDDSNNNDNNNNNDNTMNTPNNTPEQPTNNNQANDKDHLHPEKAAESPTDGPDPGQVKPEKTKKELKLYRAIEDTIALGNKIKEFLGQRSYLTKEDLFLALEILFPLNATKFTNPELIELFRQANAHRITKKTWDQYYCHISAFGKKMNKPFHQVTALDVADYIKGKTIQEGVGDTVSQSTHDHIVNVLTTFFEWLLDQGYYSRLLRNPVSVRRFTNRRRAPEAVRIFTPAEYQRLLSAVPWYAVPAVILLFKCGIRPETLPRLSWEDIDWERHVVKVPQYINKAGSACPTLSASDMALLSYWRDCSGPIIVFADTLKQIRVIAKELGIRHNWSDDARKTAISMRAGLLRDLHPTDVEAKLDYEFGNSKEVRRTFYQIHRDSTDAIAYDACTRPLPDVVLTVKMAREYRLAQIRSAVRVAMAKAEKLRQFTFTTSRDVQKKLRLKALKKAWETLPLSGCFPSFVKVQGGVDLTKHHFAKLVERMGRDVSQVHAALTEIYAHEPQKGDMEQGSLFHGKAELFLPESAISKECPPQTSSPNKQSPPDTESPKEQ